MSSIERHSDNPAFLLLKALITGQKIFYATGDGNVNKKTIVCSDLTAISDQDGNQVHIVDPNSDANGQARDISGVTTGGTINLGIAFDVQITEDTAFILTGIRSTPIELAAFEAWVKTALGAEWDGTPDLYDVLVNGGIPVWPAVANIGNNVSMAQAIRAILTSLVGSDDYDNYIKVNNTANASLNAIFQNFATLFAAADTDIFNPTIQGSARTDLELALAALATYISGSGAALSIKVNNNTARTNLEQVWEDYLAVIGCDDTNVFNPSIGGSARTTLEAALAAIGTVMGNPTSDTLTSLTAKWGDIARSLDLILGARWDAAGDLGTDVGNIITAVAAIQNNTRFTAAVPVWMCKPDAGNEAFRMASNLYDTEGNMEDPTNSEILVRIIKDDGTYITATLYKDNGFVAVLDNPTDGVTFPAASGWRAMEREAEGKYFFFNKVAHDATEESLIVEFGWTENSKNNYQSRSTEIADVHGDLAAILADTHELQTDWANGGRLDLLLDACSTHSATDVRQSVCLTGDPASSVGKLLFDNLNAPVGSIPTTPTLQATWTDAKAAFLDEAISAAKTLTVAERTAIRKSVCLTGDTANSIGKILYELYINRLTATRAGYLDELDFDLDARLDTKVAGKQQIAKTTEDLDQVAGTYDLFTGTTQDVLLESLLIRMPNIVAGGAITSISLQTDDATPQVLISAADGVVANLTAEAQLAWQNFNAPILIKTGKKIQLTIAGGAHVVAYVCDIV
jgi:hypothetical protein